MARRVWHIAIGAILACLSSFWLSCGGGVPIASPPSISVAISPKTATALTESTIQFAASVSGAADPAVRWSVNGINSGDAAVGTISAAGIYTAPATPPSPNSVTVRATSVADPSRSDSASVAIVYPAPKINSVSPSTINAGSADTTVLLEGAGFTQQSMVHVEGAAVVTVFGSSTQLEAVIPADRLILAGTLPVTVVTPSPGGGTSNPVGITVFAAVSVSPSTRTLALNQTVKFTALVSGETDQAVTWFVKDVAGGDSTVGTIDANGVYIAPGHVPVPETIIVKAVSVADPSKVGAALVTVTPPSSDNYPRPGAGSTLRSPPALAQVPVNGPAVAVLDWTAKDLYGDEEDLIAICHSLIPSGIPHAHPASLAEASAYPFLAIAGVLDNPVSLTNAERDALRSYVETGGTLLLWGATDNGVLTRLGIGSAAEQSGASVRPLTFDLLTGDHALRYIDHPVEVDWQLAYPDFSVTVGYEPGTALPLAWWETGDAGILRAEVGVGRAYVFGWRLRHILTEGERLLVRGAEPPWTNVPILDADICRLLVRGIYEGLAGPAAQVRQFAPQGKTAALIVTHDVDAVSAFVRTPEFAQLEYDRGFKATYFFTTMPYNNEWTGTIYDQESMGSVAMARDLGHEIASHSVGHFPDFDDAPPGSGEETAENYFPRYSWDLSRTVGMSTLGELGVSRWLLEADFGVTVESFRSGFLLLSQDFLQGLKGPGYRRDSTYAAGVTKGSFPFRAYKVLSGGVSAYPLVEYPIALSDETLTEDNFTAFLDAWEEVIRANYGNNAPTVLLIHPVPGPRLQALDELLLRVSDLDLWTGDLKTFGEFWEAQGVACPRWP